MQKTEYPLQVYVNHDGRLQIRSAEGDPAPRVICRMEPGTTFQSAQVLAYNPVFVALLQEIDRRQVHNLEITYGLLGLIRTALSESEAGVTSYSRED